MAVAADPPLTGKDITQVVQVTGTEGADQQKYIGRRFADNVLFWKFITKGKKNDLEAVSIDAYLHPSYTQSIYIRFPLARIDPLLKLAATGTLKQDDKISIDGLIEDVVGNPTSDEPSRTIVILKAGCRIKLGW